MIDRFAQEPAPELPGSVEGLPADLLAWVLMLVGAGYLGMRAWSVLRASAARKAEVRAEKARHAQPATGPRSALQDLADLLEAWNGQDKEAGAALGYCVRLSCSLRFDCDALAFSDAELLHAARRFHPEEDGEAEGHLPALLSMSTAAQFADRGFPLERWQEIHRRASAWMDEEQSEGTSR